MMTVCRENLFISDTSLAGVYRVNIIPSQSSSPGLGDGVKGGVSGHEGGEDMFLSLTAHCHGVGNYPGGLLLGNRCHGAHQKFDLR